MIYTVTLNPAIDHVIRVPELELGALNKIKEEYKFPGGKGINVSRILKKLGQESINLGFIGGRNGVFINEVLTQEGLGTEFVMVSEETRTNIKLKSTTETEINGLGPVIKGEELLALKEQLNQLTQDDLVVFSGSIPPGLKEDIYVELVKLVQEAKVPFIMDISSDTLLDILPLGPELIKPNHHELADIFNADFNTLEDMLPYGKKLLDKGAKNVLVSMGKDGAVLFTSDKIYHAPGIKGELINSVGAGDSMVGGFVSQYAQGKDIVTAFKYGVASGSATAFSQDLATKEDILALVETVTVVEL